MTIFSTLHVTKIARKTLHYTGCILLLSPLLSSLKSYHVTNLLFRKLKLRQHEMILMSGTGEMEIGKHT